VAVPTAVRISAPATRERDAVVLEHPFHNVAMDTGPFLS
jgi:hypothetical protein